MFPQAQVEHWNECPVCGADVRETFVDREQFTFVRCGCGLVYKSRDLVSDEERPESTWNERYTRRRRHRVAKARRQILNLLNHAEPGRLLDIGCSLGHVLEAASDLGLEASGFDINEQVVAICKERGFDAQVANLNGPYPFADGSFRLAVLKHVFEHTPTPRKTLAELRRILDPDGAVFIAVPNLEYRKALESPETYRFFQPGKGGSGHYVYYTPDHLSRLLDQEGFRTVRVHPHHWQRRASLPGKVLNAIGWPGRALLGPLRTRLGLRREFWLIAVRA